MTTGAFSKTRRNIHVSFIKILTMLTRAFASSYLALVVLALRPLLLLFAVAFGWFGPWWDGTGENEKKKEIW